MNPSDTLPFLLTGAGLKFIVDAIKAETGWSGPRLILLVALLALTATLYSRYAPLEVRQIVDAAFAMFSTALGLNFGLKQLTGRSTVQQDPLPPELPEPSPDDTRPNLHLGGLP